MLRFMGKTGINSSFFYAQLPDIPDIPELLESLEPPEHSESQETPESPEHPESPRPDFFSPGINNKKNRKPLHTPLGAGTDEGIRALYFRLVLPIQVRVCQGFLLMGYVMALIPLSSVGAHVYVLVASYCAISFSCSSARAISAFSLSTRRFISSMRELPFFEETERKQILFS